MDPRETLRIADQAVSDLDSQTAQEALASYWRWRERGGYQPYTVAGTFDHGDAFARKVWDRLKNLMRHC